jgi:flavin reductase (DIM6/NTAB) family NADH-FMN oxidoreductase RutF
MTPMTDEAMDLSGRLAEPERFRRSFRGVAGCVAILLARDQRGVQGITCTSAGSLSLNPPMIVMCLDDKTNMNPIVSAAGEFSLNYVDTGFAWLARAFSARNQSLDHIAHAVIPGRTGVPTLSYGTTSVLECGLAAIYPGGDHSILVGLVRHARFQYDTAPLLYHAGHYGTFAAECPAAESDDRDVVIGPSAPVRSAGE